MFFPVQNWWLKAKQHRLGRCVSPWREQGSATACAAPAWGTPGQDPAGAGNPSCNGITWHCSASLLFLVQDPTEGIAHGLMKQWNRAKKNHTSVILKKEEGFQGVCLYIENKNDKSPLATSLLRFLPASASFGHPMLKQKDRKKNKVSEGLVCVKGTSVNEWSSRIWQIFIRNKWKMLFKGGKAKPRYLKVPQGWEGAFNAAETGRGFQAETQIKGVDKKVSRG